LRVTTQSDATSPQREYERRLEARRARRELLLRQHFRISRARNFLLGAMVFQVLLTEKETAVVFVLSSWCLPCSSLSWCWRGTSSRMPFDEWGPRWSITSGDWPA
jgi:hypothetical protein